MILAVLSEGPLHGYGMIKAVATRSPSGVLLDPANLYRVLRRMRGLGWIEHHPEPDSRQRVYVLTVEGRAVLSAEASRLGQLLAHVRPEGAAG
jgi:PadR family transcriptional regulator PadR